MTATQTTAETDAAGLTAEGWVRVGRLADLPMLEGRRTTIAGRRVAVFRLAGDALAAIDATCPHKGGPLQDGLVADDCVTCPLHDRRVDLTTGQMLGHDDVVAVHGVQLVGGDVWVRVAEGPAVAGASADGATR
ncbi:MAG: Rieske 2Fe-2S domain-containing protein [Solirubrobacteraceae bacterium]|nr:nitrite reductase (NAD(P)H) small subunit [Patulibacter sp.]